MCLAAQFMIIVRLITTFSVSLRLPFLFILFCPVVFKASICMAALQIALGLMCFFPDSSSSSTFQRLQVTANQIFWEMQGVPLFWFLFSNSLLRTTSSFTSFHVEFMMILQQPHIYLYSCFPFSVSNTNLICFVIVSMYSCYCIGCFLSLRLVFSNSANFNGYCAICLAAFPLHTNSCSHFFHVFTSCTKFCFISVFSSFSSFSAFCILHQWDVMSMYFAV